MALCTWLGSQSPCRESHTDSVMLHWCLYFTVGGMPCLGSHFIFPSRKAQLDASYICSVPFSVCVQNLFWFCSSFSLNRKLTKWPHLPRPGFVHKGNPDLHQPWRGVPLLSPWAGIATAIPHTGQPPGPPRENALCGFVFLRSGEDTVKRVWLTVEYPGCLEPRLGEVM